MRNYNGMGRRAAASSAGRVAGTGHNERTDHAGYSSVRTRRLAPLVRGQLTESGGSEGEEAGAWARPNEEEGGKRWI